MSRSLPLLLLVALTQASRLSAAEPAELAEATFLVTGLHCPPCTKTVEASVAAIPGVHSIVVDWKTKAAKVKFDPAAANVWTISEHVAATRHMMGGRLKYAAWLALSVPTMKDDAAGETIKKRLRSVMGVAEVSTYPKQRIVAVRFDGKTEVALDQLVQAMNEAGYAAKTY